MTGKYFRNPSQICLIFIKRYCEVFLFVPSLSETVCPVRANKILLEVVGQIRIYKTVSLKLSIKGGGEKLHWSWPLSPIYTCTMKVGRGPTEKLSSG